MPAPKTPPDNQSTPVGCKTPLGANRQPTYTEPLRSTTAVPNPAAALQKQIAFLNRDPTKPIPAPGGTVHIGIDSEWQHNPETGINEILCYTAHVVNGERSCDYIYHTKGKSPSRRLTLNTFISKALRAAMKAGVITEMPAKIIVCAHFLRADLAHFSNFFPEFSRQIDGLRRTVTSLKGNVEINFEDEEQDGCRFRGGNVIVTDASNQAYSSSVRFIDTMLLTPAGMGLKEAGELIGIKKLELPLGYDITQMEKLFAERPKEAREYAIRDAVITVRYYLKIAEIATSELGLRAVPPTIGAMAVRMFKKTIEESGRNLADIFGTTVERSVYWNPKKCSPVRKTRQRTGPDRSIFEQFAAETYQGGRNEAFHVGPTPVGVYNDFDLIGAYPVGMVDLLELNYRAAYSERNPAAYVGHVFGLVRARFSFSADTRFPSLPVRTAERGLYFPLEGVTYCTAPEIEVALGLGAKIEILSGVIIPWVEGSRPVFEDFVRLVRAKRLIHPKGSLEERLWKEIGNSLYGKLAQGVREKSVFDTRTGKGRDVPPSPITNPYFATHTTGFVRAVVSEAIARVPVGRRVISVTTDGFLTDASLKELDITGPMCRRFLALYERVHGAPHDV